MRQSQKTNVVDCDMQIAPGITGSAASTFSGIRSGARHALHTIRTVVAVALLIRRSGNDGQSRSAYLPYQLSCSLEIHELNKVTGPLSCLAVGFICAGGGPICSQIAMVTEEPAGNGCELDCFATGFSGAGKDPSVVYQASPTLRGFVIVRLALIEGCMHSKAPKRTCTSSNPPPQLAISAVVKPSACETPQQP